MSNYEFESVFEKTIDSLVILKAGVPAFVPAVCKYIKMNSESKGIFRIPGNATLVNQLGQFLSLPNCSIPPSACVNDAVSFLKKWLNSLPVPLVNPVIIMKHNVAENPNFAVDIVKDIPGINRRTLAYIISVLKSVLENAQRNEMNMSNLSICFHNSLFQSNKGLSTGINFAAFVNSLIPLLNETETDFSLE